MEDRDFHNHLLELSDFQATCSCGLHNCPGHFTVTVDGENTRFDYWSTGEDGGFYLSLADTRRLVKLLQERLDKFSDAEPSSYE